ncbi:MAG TPA: UDP-glucose 4-epimerase [Elusimicrobia bacterium]|nr:MAG: UDP-glucose 4-epimerase [Elusimicrobia bacterium GWC2_65_9]HAZ07866.1 UDP-glucose 4-epimerase [Elusimicrobiota bacterium]
MKVLVTGAAGYIGCVLVPKLIDAGHTVLAYDIMYYGDAGLRPHPRLQVVKADLRDTPSFAKAVKNCEAVIHLACISNDPSFELDAALGKSINFDCFEPMVLAGRAAGVKRFIYASSSSVYGVSESPNVDEIHPLKPLTDYSKFKAMCEEVLARLKKPGFTACVIRPATVCGYSPRTRMDLSVNILTNLAVNKRRITVFGGSQKRPNIHIDDISDLYVELLALPAETIDGRTWNAGYQNHAIADLAKMAKTVVEREFPEKAPIEIVTSPTDDLRSYHVSSEKIARDIGFRPKRTVEDAIRDLCRAFKAGKLPNSLSDPRYFNVQTMKAVPAAPAV